MADYKFKVNTDRLNKDAEQVWKLVISMREALDSMSERVKALNGMWEGVSKDAFVKAFSEDESAAINVLKRLESFYQQEVLAKSNYENCENQVADLVANMRI